MLCVLNKPGCVVVEFVVEDGVVVVVLVVEFLKKDYFQEFILIL